MTEPDLATRLEQLRGEIGALRARHSEDYGQVMLLLAAVKKLREELAEAISQHQLDEPPAPYWLGLSSDDYAGQLHQLREWVERVGFVQYPTYLGKLPPCWDRHPEMVLELSNMMTEWTRVYGDPENRPLQDALWFHERWLPDFLGRLEKWFRCDVSGCRLARSSPWERAPPRYT